MNDFFLIGRIRAVANENGYLGIVPFSDFIDRYEELDKVFINVFGGCREFFVENAVINEKSVLLKFKNFNSREDVDFLVGKEIFILSEDSIVPDENTFFIHDLIDCEVYRNGKFFGKVKDILNLPSNDVLVIDKESQEVLIPFIDDYVNKVDVGKRKIFLINGSEDFYDDEN